MEDNHNNDRFDFEMRRALLEDSPQPDADRAFEQFKQRAGIRKSKWVMLRPYVAVAAAACVGALCYLIFSLGGDEDMGKAMEARQRQLAGIGNVVYVADDNRSVISLSLDGKTIDLDAKSQGQKPGLLLTADKLVRMFEMSESDHDEATISVPHGQIATVMLSDSTRITLNAGSKLAFPCHFDKKGMRKVSLQGEGYFEVKHDERHPFVVNGKQLDVTVLGTVFDVRCFDQEQARVALLQGKVSVEVAQQQTILEPGQMAVVGVSGFVSLETADIDQVLGWKNGLFYFDGQSLREIMMEIGRWYNMSVVFASNHHIDERLHFSMERNVSVAEAIRQLQLISTASIQMKQEQNTIIVK